jgi:ER lumen protein retaining receptor
MDGFGKIKDVVGNKENLMFEIRKRKRDVIFWIAGVIFILITFLFLSSKDYSFMIVLSSTIQMMSFIIILMKVVNLQNCSGISTNTLICYSLILGGRLCSTLFYNGYLPSDQAGDWFYQLTEIIGLVCVLFLIFMIKNTYRETADVENDQIDFKYLVIPAFGLALLVHTSLNRNFLTDVLWTFSMYCETVAIYPQIFLFQKKGGHIESFTSHYVALQGLSRLFSLLFWWDTYSELNESIDDSYSLFHTYCGYFIIASQLIQLIIMADYYYIYFKSMAKGESMNLSASYNL